MSAPIASENRAHDAANLGYARPPLVYLGSILLGAALEALRPLPLVPGGVGSVLGPVLIVAAVLLFVASVREFRAAGTPIPGNRPATALVTSGPYALSRNPIYLAFSTLHLGVAFWISSVWLVVTLAAVTAFMTVVVVAREERYMERKFGDQYTDYKGAVRRWL